MTEIPNEALKKAAELANAEDHSYPIGAEAVRHSSIARSFARYIADVSEGAKKHLPLVGIGSDTRAFLQSLILPNPEDDLLKEVSQAAQDHMEQHHAVCLTASSWDALARTMIAALRKGRE